MTFWDAVILALLSVLAVVKLTTWGLAAVIWWQRRRIARLMARLMVLRAEAWRRESRR